MKTMEPLNDDELNKLLREWKAPDAPSSLRPPSRPEPLWKWLLTGSIRIPVPVSAAVALILLFLTVQALRPRMTVDPHQFQPVRDVSPRLIRSTNYEDVR